MTIRNFSNIAADTTLDGAITDSATTLDVVSATGFPAVPFTIKINDEVILVGAVATNTFSSLVRGLDGTTAAAHSNGDVVNHVGIAQDFAWDPEKNLEFGKTDTDTPDDDFDSGTLDVKWTVVSGSSGTVDMERTTASSAIYDLDTRPGDLLFQASNDDMSLRQDYTLPDGNSLILACTPNISFDTGIAINEMLLELALNDNDSAANVGTNRVAIVVATTSSNYSIIGVNQASTTISTNPHAPVGKRVYLRINRSGSTYYMYSSYDGNVWTPMGESNPASTPNNVWIGVRSSTNTADPKAIMAIHWVRQGNNNLDPW